MNRRTGLGVAVAVAVAAVAVTLFVPAFGALDAPGPVTDDQPTETNRPADSVAGDDRTTTRPPRFTRVDPDRGFNYTSTFTASDGMIGNAGVYATDYDDDGWPDLLVVGGERPALFENTGGDFTRSDALPAIDGYVKSAHFLDADADGDDDLLLLRPGDSPRFLENTGGDFERASVGLSNVSLTVPTGAASADYDGDGCLDLFVFQNGDWSGGFPGDSENRQAVLEGTARPTVTDGSPNLLFDGNCDGFENVTADAGIRGDKWSLAASFVDLTGDGRPDVHVANDFSHDVLYRNLGNGTFERVDLGPATDRNAMSSEIVDLNGDGRLDVFVTNIYFRETMHLVNDGDGREVSMQKSSLSLNPDGNNLLLNRGNGTFEDGAPAFGLRKGGWGWAASAADFDNDGHLDLVHTTSSDIPIAEYGSLGYDYPQIWSGTAAGFEKRNSSALGLDETNGRGLVAIDYDRDGDLELVVANGASYETGRVTRGTFAVYDTDAADGKSLSLTVERNGTTSIGARVIVTTDERTRLRVLNSRSDFLSQEPRTVHVGLGTETVETVRVVWPDGTERTFTGLPDSQHLVITPDGVDPVESGRP